MFDAIAGPTNPYEGPAVGHSTEKGDSWHTAVGKINAGFKAVIAALEAPFSADSVEIVDGEARKEIADLRETVAALQIRLDGMTTAATPPTVPPATEAPAVPPVHADPAPVMDGNPEDGTANG